MLTLTPHACRYWNLFSGGDDGVVDPTTVISTTSTLRTLHFFFFFFTLVTGPRRSLSLQLSDTTACEPQISCTLHHEIENLDASTPPPTAISWWGGQHPPAKLGWGQIYDGLRGHFLRECDGRSVALRATREFSARI